MAPTTMKTVPPRSLERQRLHVAIERRAAAVAQHERVSDALAKLDDAVYENLEPAVRRAREALDEAIAAAPELLVAATLGEPVADTPTVADAEAALNAADQALRDGRAARSLLRDELRDREVAVDEAGKAVDAAAKQVVSSDPAKLAVVREFFAASRRALMCARVIRTFGGVVTGVTSDSAGLSLRINDILALGDHSRSSYSPDPAWAAALQELKVDADAQFPALPELEPEPAPAAAAA